MSANDFIFGSLGLLLFLIMSFVVMIRAPHYNTETFLSKEYALLCLGAACATASYYIIKPQETGIHIAMGIGGATFLTAMVLNIKKSSVPFGIIFTFWQTIMIGFFFMTIFSILRRKLENSGNLR